MRQFDRSTANCETGGAGRLCVPTRCQLGAGAVPAFGLTETPPSSVPTYTPSPPSAEPIALIRQPRAPFGAVPGHPVVRSGLITFQWTLPADGVSALSVR